MFLNMCFPKRHRLDLTSNKNHLYAEVVPQRGLIKKCFFVQLQHKIYMGHHERNICKQFIFNIDTTTPAGQFSIFVNKL